MPSRVRSRRDFARLASSRVRARSGPLRVTFSPGGAGDNWAYAIPKSNGSAVVRNRLRRRLRVLIDEHSPRPLPGNYLIKCSFESTVLSYVDLRNHVRELIEGVRGQS